MIRNNNKVGGMCKYFDIQHYKKGSKTEWIAWFFVELAATDLVEALDEEV